MEITFRMDFTLYEEFWPDVYALDVALAKELGINGSVLFATLAKLTTQQQQQIKDFHRDHEAIFKEMTLVFNWINRSASPNNFAYWCNHLARFRIHEYSPIVQKALNKDPEIKEIITQLDFWRSMK